MSSHHVVREKQEPALYIHELGSFDEENLGQLLEWSPTLIVNETEYEKIISLGHKVDLVISANESIDTQEHTRLIKVERDELSDVFDYLVADHYPAVNVVAAEVAMPAALPFLDQINIVFFNAIYKTYFIRSGFKIWKPKGILFMINAITPFQATNLAEHGNGLFEVAEDGFVEFTFETPYLPISEQL